MTRKKALEILGLTSGASEKAIKKRYRELMAIIHPDAGGEHNYPYDAADINIAYEYLMKNEDEPEETEVSGKKHGKKSVSKWNAPVNPNAYAEREIYHKVEDSDGTVIGQIVIDEGKYIWTEEEDFSLFLRSLYQCSKQIIFDADPEGIRLQGNDIKLLSELTYLLAQQFVDTEMILSLLAKVVSEDEIYQIPAMLEISGRNTLKKGETIYPSRLQQHKLYVKNTKGKELGYLSFKDDRLYYGIIPLFERRSTRVKMQIHGDDVKRSNGKRYLDVDLYMKIDKEKNQFMVESISLKIEELLR